MPSPHRQRSWPERDERIDSSLVSLHKKNRTPPARRRWFMVLGALAALPLMSGCQAETAPAPEVRRPVQVMHVTLTSREKARDFVGVIRARYETDLGFRVAGKMVARLVNAGDRVRAGDVIARLDPADLKLQVESAEAEWNAASTNLAQASAELARYTTLKARGFASIADFDRKQAAKAEADGRLERARRALDLARNQLGYAELKADADGVITATLAEPGQVVTVGQAVVHLARRGEREALVALPETWLAEARQAKATVRLWTEPDRSFAAKLRELSPQADPATRTYAARFTLTDLDDTVALGMTATVQLVRAADQPSIRLPLSAILNRGEGPSVFVVTDADTLALRPVRVASFNEETAFVTAGLGPGETVVTLGVQKLTAGAKVRTIE
jgi:RND family efflux transporter MFP subunit